MEIKIPEFSLIALVGISGSGKSTFAKKHFKPTEVISSDYCRGLVSDDENDQAATQDAFEVLRFIAEKRLSQKRLTVIDATNIQMQSRKPILEMARKFHCLPVIIALNTDEKVCAKRNEERADRNFASYVLRQQKSQLRRSLRSLKKEGFRYVYQLKSEEEVENVTIVRQKLWTDKRDESGPFDIIGDVHGCFDELNTLLQELGYIINQDLIRSNESAVIPPEGRKLIFLGDLIDRGPKSPEVLALTMNMVRHEVAHCIPGNHETKLLKYLRGKNVQMKHGLERTVAQLEKEPEEFKTQVEEFIDSLISHYVFDKGKLVVAHAGMREDMQGRASGKVRAFALYGETTGETDEFGLPIRYNWAAEYRGHAMVVYGHTPVPEAEWLNNTICIDTGCVFGGKLTALRYPERELISVPAKEIYYDSVKPLDLIAPELSAQQAHDDLLDFEDVGGKRIISTDLRQNVTIREENATAALEVMSRFAINPKWLIYLPPTMSPCETSQHEGFLEHPEQAFAYYKKQGVSSVVCEEKHMGSRTVIVLCKNEDVAKARFGVTGEGIGVCFTRTGRAFFNNKSLEQEFLKKIIDAANAAKMWDKLETDWICLDCELMPWSFKAKELLRTQYAAVGTAGTHAINDAIDCIRTAVANGKEVDTILSALQQKKDMVQDYIKAYQNYCWNFSGIDDLKLAPFHILATEGKVYVDKDHRWHMETIKEICEQDTTLLLATPYRVLDLEEDSQVADAVKWWSDLTNVGGEGMVVKPFDFIAKGKKGLLQPAVKCRGPEYLRIIYGPEYNLPKNLSRLRKRGLSTKRSLALREFALGVEALRRFVRKEPLRKIHECVFGVLALESEPVDPRL